MKQLYYHTFSVPNISRKAGKAFWYVVILLAILTTPLLNSYSFAQNSYCGTASPTPQEIAQLIQSLASSEKSILATTGDVLYVPIKAHILTKADGSGGISEATLLQSLAYVNRVYINSNIQFYYFGSYHYIPDDRFYNFHDNDEATLGQFNDISNVINMYFANSVSVAGSAVGGYAYLPNGPDRIFIVNRQGNDDKTVAHELGHYFGLLHTFQNSTSTDPKQRETVARTNCSTKGDLICDTSADPYGLNGVTISNCKYTGTAKDLNGATYTPPLDNIMSYYFYCGNKFTPLQFDRIGKTAVVSRAYLRSSATGPDAPSQLNAYKLTDGIHLTWQDNSSNELGFIIEQSDNPFNGFSCIGIVGPNEVAFADLGATNLNYFYRVKPVNTSASFSNIAHFKQYQSLTFDPIADRFIDQPKLIGLAAKASSGLPVSFRLVGGPATLVGNQLTINGAGAITITAFQNGDNKFVPATSIVRTFNVLKLAQTISFGAIPDQEVTQQSPIELKATSSSGLPVSFRIISGPAQVSGSKLTVKGIGTVTVEAFQSGNAIYSSAEAKELSFIVRKAAQSIVFASITDRTIDQPASLDLIATASSKLPVSFEVVAGPATLAGSKLSVQGAGIITIRASQPGNQTVAAAGSVERSFTVSKLKQSITFAPIADRTIDQPSSFELVAMASSKLPVAFRVVAGSASIAGSKLSIQGTGIITVRASQVGNGTFLASESVERSFTVSKIGQSIAFASMADRTIDQPASLDLMATASSKLLVSFEVVIGPATLTGSKLSIHGAGIITIRASQGGSATYYPAESVDRSFTVKKLPQTISFSNLPTHILQDNDTLLLSATTSSGLPVTFSVVDGPGRLKGEKLSFEKPGLITIRALQEGNQTYTAAPFVEVSFCVVAPVIVSVQGSTLKAREAKDYQWYVDGIALPGANEGKMVASSSGSYTVSVTDSNGCKAVSKPVNFILTAVEPMGTDNIRIYPNPTTGRVIIQLPKRVQSQKISLSLFNSLGQLISIKDLGELQDDQAQLDFSQLANGVYWVRMEYGNKSVFGAKMIKVDE